MRLITKDGVAPNISPENETAAFESVAADLSRSENEPLNYKTKLKIEIEPEVEVKEPVRFRQPRSRTVSVSPRETREDSAEPLAASAAQPYEEAVESIPDGTPYEKADERPAAPVRSGMTVYDEVRALRESDMDMLREADLRRTKKIQIESSLLTRSRSLINLSEVLTKELLPSVMERMDVCTCPVCTGNVLALALNALPTKYVTTDEGKQYTQLEVYKRQNELDVIAALTRACLRVKDSPRHEIIDDLNE
jgi:competence protein ComFB